MAIKTGIIGVGNMGKNHVRLLRQMNNEFDFIGAFDPDRNQIEKLGLTNCVYDSEDALIDACDAVVVAAPSSLHKNIALKVAEAGKHLLLEKPIALSAEDAEEILQAFEGKNLVFQVGHVERFNPVIIELEKIIKDERIIAIHMERCSSKDLRISDTDVVYDLMIHDIDILINGLVPGEDISKLRAFGTKVYSENYMDYVEAGFQFKSGVIASVISSRATENKIRKAYIHCENAFIEADLLNRSLNISRKTVFNLNLGYDPVYRQENIVEKVFISNEEPLRSELKCFYDGIGQLRTIKNSGKDAVRSVRVLDMIKKKIYPV